VDRKGAGDGFGGHEVESWGVWLFVARGDGGGGGFGWGAVRCAPWD
jgi:hypothetical protein